MIKINKNDKAYKELAVIAQNKNISLKDLLLSNEHQQEVSKKFYEHMPKIIKWSMKYEQFDIFYGNNKAMFVSKIA